MASIFKKLDDLWAYEDMLKILTDIAATRPAPTDEDLCFRVAHSLCRTSEVINRVLSDYWCEMTGDGDDDIPKNVQLPCLHRAAQYKHGGVASAMLTLKHDIELNPGTYDQQRVRVAKWLDLKQDSIEVIQRRVGIDARDACQRTALHAAADSGSQDGCSVLINALADPNARDDQLHTVLEVAAGRSQFDIVKQLIGVGAEPNPDLALTTSSPLQAALESPNPNYKLIRYLLAQGADEYIRRQSDNKNANEIARERGYNLAAMKFDSPHTASASLPSHGGQWFSHDQR